jgi:hypothetical protein
MYNKKCNGFEVSMPNDRDLAIGLANEVIAATERYKDSLVRLEPDSPVAGYVEFLSPYDTAFILGISLAAVNQMIAERKVSVIGKRKRYVLLAVVDALRARPITVAEYFAAVKNRRGHLSTAGEEKPGSISPPRTSAAAVDTSGARHA